MNRPEKLDTTDLENDAAAVAADLSGLARQAVTAIREAADEFAAKAGVKTDEAVSAVKSAGNAAADGVGALAGNARSVTETGLASLGERVGRNPLSALALAAGAGLLLGLITRPDQK